MYVDTFHTYNEFVSLPENKQQEVADLVHKLKKEAEEEMPKQEEKRTGFGSLKGLIWMSPDFDEPLEDFKDYM